MNSIFDANLKLFKTSSLEHVEWRDEIEDLKLLVLALLANSQQDLIVSNILSTITTDELRELTKIEIENEEYEYNGMLYDINTIILKFPKDFFKPQTITFINTKDCNSLILIKCFPKLQNLIFHWLKNKHSLVVKSLRFSSQFIIDTLNYIIDGLLLKDKLGDVELQFQTNTEQNALNSINIEIINEDILKFVEIKEEQSLLEILYEYLNGQTSIDFSKLNLSKMKCSFILITYDGKLKFNKGLPKLQKSELINFTVWDFIYKIYQTI